MVHKVQGSITVFLSFILVMILALIGTLLDVARINMADSFSYRALVSAVDTEFTKYCSELYDDYHIYMLGNGHNVSEISGEDFINSMTEYLMYTFDSDRDLGVLGSNLSIKGTDLLDLSIEQCNVDSTVALTDYDATIFEDQVAQYMKYYVAGNAADTILEKLNLMKQSGDTMTVVRKKNEVDEAVAKVDKKLMKLMQEVEGITFKNNALVVTDDYTIKVQKSFAKQFCIGKAGPNAVGINHNVVWDSLKGSYIDPVEALNSIKTDITTYKESAASVESLTKEISDLDDQIQKLELELIKKPLEIPTEAPQPSASSLPLIESKKDSRQEELKKLEEQRKEKQEELDEKNKQLSPLIESIKKKSQTLYLNATNVHNHTVAAIGCIDEVQTAKNNSLTKITNFESTLSEYKSKLSSDSYQGIQEEYQGTKDYIEKYNKQGEDTSVVGNVLKMKDTLSTNQTILENTRKVAATGVTVSNEKVDELDSLIGSLEKQYNSYSIKNLAFDYSTLQVNEKTESPFDTFSSLIGSGILGLVVDDVDSLSKETVSTSGLASTKCQEETVDSEADEKNNDDLAGKLKEQDSDKGSGISENLENYEENCKSASAEGSTANDLARKFLMNEYGVTNFVNLMDQLTADETAAKETESNKKESMLNENKETQSKGTESNNTEEAKPTKLKYEQEYLVIGGASDLENAKSIVMRTLFMRTAVNYLSLLTNSKCRSQAKGMATTLVGFTGFAPLIAITEQLILIAWGFEEGLVDSRVMLDGGSVAFMKKANEFNVQFGDLLKINKETVKKKAAEAEKKKQGVGSLGYNDYLRLYLFMVPLDTLSYRMMDLIQENMRLRYDSQFSITNGIFGTKVSMEVSMPGKFLTIPFIKEFAGYDGSTMKLQVSTEYSY